LLRRRYEQLVIELRNVGDIGRNFWRHIGRNFWRHIGRHVRNLGRYIRWNFWRHVRLDRLDDDAEVQLQLERLLLQVPELASGAGLLQEGPGRVRLHEHRVELLRRLIGDQWLIDQRDCTALR
jgi:hypothetical protein